MAMLVAGGGWYAVGAFPMQQGPGDMLVSKGPGPLERAAKPITPENPIPRRVQVVQADYPAEAAAAQASGSIVLRVTLDATGRVAEVRRVSGSVRTGSPAVTVAFTDSSIDGQPRLFLRGGTTEAQPGFTSSRAVFDAIDLLTRPAVAAVRQWSYEPPADAPISFGITFRFHPDGQTTSAQTTGGTAAAAASTAPPQWTTDGALRVGGSVKPPTKIRDVKPVYPQDARDAGIQGVVIIEARIEPDGSVSNTRVLRSVPELDQAALDAVTQWQFVPTLLNGQAMPVIMTVTVNFTLK
jgi:protein TonB